MYGSFALQLSVQMRHFKFSLQACGIVWSLETYRVQGFRNLECNNIYRVIVRMLVDVEHQTQTIRTL